MRRLGKVLALSVVLCGGMVSAAEVGTGDVSLAVHLSGMAHSINRSGPTVVGGAEVDVGVGLVPRLRLEGVGMALFDFDDWDTRQYLLGARPLIRLGGILGDFEVGASIYGAFGGTSGEERVSLVLGPHFRYTLALLSVFYEPLFFNDQDFTHVVTPNDFGDAQFFPVRFGVGLQF